MEFATIEKLKTLSDQAQERLIEAIVRGALKPGMRIPEATLARQLGISRGPLREAVRRLEGRGLLVRVPHVGVSVANPSTSELIDIFAIRQSLEGLACRQAVERMTGEELDELERLLDAHEESTELKKGEAYYQGAGDYDFHYKIVQGSRNARLWDMFADELYHFIRIFRYRSSVTPGRARQAFDEHRAIVAAMRRRDADEAERLMRVHTGHALNALKTAQQPSPAAEGISDHRPDRQRMNFGME